MKMIVVPRPKAWALGAAAALSWMVSGCTTSAPAPAPQGLPAAAVSAPALTESLAAPAPTPAAAPPAPASAAALAAYRPAGALSGRLRSVGSDSMNELLPLWSDEFRRFHPELRVFFEGKGSSTAMPALLEGRSDIAPMSRPLKDGEVAGFQERFRYAPTLLRVAVDALAVYVHPANPVGATGMDLTQLDAVFSSTRARGGAEEVRSWGQLGLAGGWARAPIHVYGRNSASGTYAFFLDHVLGKTGKYTATLREMVGSAELVQAVAHDPFAIGYSGIAYQNETVVALPLAQDPGGTAVTANEANTIAGTYPLARFLYLVVNLHPQNPPTALQREFITFVYSAEGQNCVRRSGFFPVSSEIAAEELSRIRR